MKNITTYLNEAFDAPFDLNDELTRSYNNIFGMMSDTLLRKCCPGCDCNCYLLTGSACRNKEFLFNTLEYNPDYSCPADFFERAGLEVYHRDGTPVLHTDMDPLDPECTTHCASCIKDTDYFIVC